MCEPPLDLKDTKNAPGNIHVYQEALMPPNVRNVSYVISINATSFRRMLKKAVQFPKSCEEGSMIA